MRVFITFNYKIISFNKEIKKDFCFPFRFQNINFDVKYEFVYKKEMNGIPILFYGN